MASETAPTYNTSIFNQSNFNTSGGDALDYAYLASHYLQYPTGQSGIETIYDLVVSNSGVNNNLEIGTAPKITAGIGGVGGTLGSQTRTALGKNALIVSATTNGQNNTALGSQALEANTTGANNTSIGYLSQHIPTTSVANTGVGGRTLQTATTSANNNTAVGYFTLDAITSGNYNTCIGRNSGGVITTGSNNITLGVGSGNSANRSATIAIGNNAEPGADAEIRIGDATNITAVYFPQLKPQYTVGSTNTAQIGCRTSYTLTTGNKTIGTTMTGVVSFSLPAGAWIVQAWAYIGMTTVVAGYNVLTISTANATDTGIHTTCAYVNTASSAVSVVGVFNFSTTTTIYINAKGTHSSAFYTSGDDNNSINVYRVA